MNPWTSLTGGTAPPEWRGPARVHRLPDEEEAPAEDLEQLQQLQRRALAAVLRALPAWSLIQPGTPREALMRQAPSGLWWPRPGDHA